MWRQVGEGFVKAILAFFVNLPTTHHDFFGSDGALPTNSGREGRPSFQNGLVTPATSKTASVTAARKLFAPLFTGRASLTVSARLLTS